MTSLPTWAVYTLGFGSPAATAVIAAWGNYLSRRAARELEARSKREEVMRVLRWAAELTVSQDAAKMRLGVDELEALLESKLLDPGEEGFVYAALYSGYAELRKAMDRSPDVQLVRVTDDDVTGSAPVSSEQGEGQEGGGV